MKFGKVQGIDKPVSRLVQGGVFLGSAQSEENFKVLDASFEGGCNTYDTAHCYGAGDSERTLGKWMRDRDIRDQVVICTKGAHPTADRRRVTPLDISSDLRDSLARFQTDTIDMYALHRDDPEVPVGPIIEVLNVHLRAGKIRAFGGSNWSHERLREANEYARANGLAPFAFTSPNFSLAVQIKPPWSGCISISGPECREARGYYEKERIPVFAWSSLAGGFFSGRFHRDNLDSFEHYYDKLCVEVYASDENFERLRRVQTLADEKGVTIPHIAMAYVMNQSLDLFALVGCRSAEEFQCNVEALDIDLTQEQMAWLNLESDEGP